MLWGGGNIFELLFITEATTISGGRNVAFNKTTWQSGHYDDKATSDKAVDGCTETYYLSACCIHTKEEWRPWWQIDLGAIYNIREIVMIKRWECE